MSWIRQKPRPAALGLALQAEPVLDSLGVGVPSTGEGGVGDHAGGAAAINAVAGSGDLAESAPAAGAERAVTAAADAGGAERRLGGHFSVLKEEPESWRDEGQRDESQERKRERGLRG